MAYIGKSPTGTGVRSRYHFTASGGETSLSGADDNGKTLAFSDGEYVDVYVNGVLLFDGDYNVTTANTIAGLAALTASDVVEIVVYDIFTVADTVSAKDGGTFKNDVTVNGTVTADGVSLGDNEKAQFGAGNDLQVYHDGSHSYIKDAGTGNLLIDATDLRLRSSSGEVFLSATENGAVSLRHDNSTKIATTSSGVDVTGSITASSDFILGSTSYGLVFGNTNGVNILFCIGQRHNL